MLEPRLFTCAPPVSLASLPPVEVEYDAIFDRLSVRIDPRPDRAYARSAGIEGVGDQAFSDEDGRLIDLDLHVPAAGGTIAPGGLEAIRAAVRARATPGQVELIDDPIAIPGARVIHFFRPFGAAFFWFDEALAGAPPDAYARVADELDLVEIAAGIVLGLDRRHHGVRVVLAERFDRRQRLGPHLCTAETYGAAFMDALGELQLASRTPRSLEELDRIVTGLLASAASSSPAPPRDALERLAGIAARAREAIAGG